MYDCNVDSRLGDIVLGIWGEGKIMEIISASAAGEIVRVQWLVPCEEGHANKSIRGTAWFRTASLRLKQRA